MNNKDFDLRNNKQTDIKNILLFSFLVLCLLVILGIQSHNKNVDSKETSAVNTTQEQTQVKSMNTENIIAKHILTEKEFDVYLEQVGFETEQFDESFNKEYFNLTKDVAFENVVVKSNDTSKIYYATYYSARTAFDAFKRFQESVVADTIKTGYVNYDIGTGTKNEDRIVVERVNNILLISINDNEDYRNSIVFDQLDNNENIELIEEDMEHSNKEER